MKLRKGLKITIGSTQIRIISASNTGENIVQSKNCTFKLNYLTILKYI